MQNLGREMILVIADFAFNMFDLVKDPASFDEAYNHPRRNKSQRSLGKIKKLDIPNGRNCIKISGFLKRNETKRNFSSAVSGMWLQSNPWSRFSGKICARYQ
jgi:hypothetical protein